MQLNFRVMFAFSLLASVLVTVPLCIYLRRIRQWHRTAAAVASVLATVALYTLMFFATTYMEILNMHPTAYLIFLVPLLITSALAAGLISRLGNS